MRAVSEFLLRDALELLLEDPTPAAVAQGMAKAGIISGAITESQSQTEEASEDSESLSMTATASRPPFATSLPRVVMVRSTQSAERKMVIVDRGFSAQALVTTEVLEDLRKRHGFPSLARLRGGVVRLDRYYYATPARCRGGSEGQASSRMRTRSNGVGLWLCIESLAVIDDSELAVSPQPELVAQPIIRDLLRGLSSVALDERLMLRQGRSPVAPDCDLENSSIGPSRPTAFDDNHPLLEEDCVIPEEQERQLADQDGWGVDDADSERPVVSSAESQPDLAATTNPDQEQPESETSGSPVPNTQGEEFPYEQGSISQAFIECSDTESEGGGAIDSENDGGVASDDATGFINANGTEPSHSEPFSQNTPVEESSQSGTFMDSIPTNGSSDAPITQRQDSVPELEQQNCSMDETQGEFVGGVAIDHDEPMTQVEDSQGYDGSQTTANTSAVEARWHTQLSDESETQLDSHVGSASNRHHVHVVDNSSGNWKCSVNESERVVGTPLGAQEVQNHLPAEANQAISRMTLPRSDGQANILDSQQSPTTTNVTQRRKRRRPFDSDAIELRTSGPDGQVSTVLSPPPSAVNRFESQKVIREPGMLESLIAAAQSGAAMLAYSNYGRVAPPDGSHIRHRASLPASRQRIAFAPFPTVPRISPNSMQSQARPSKRYQHLLPPFNLGAITKLIAQKKE